MKYLLILILPILFILGCKKPEEVKPENLNSNDDSYLNSIITERVLYYSFDYGKRYHSNDTIYEFFSNMKSGYNDGIDYLNPEYRISVDREDSISIDESKYTLYTIRQKLNSEIVHNLSVKTKNNKIYKYKLALKRSFISFDYSRFQDSLCVDSINIQRNVNYNKSIISQNSFDWRDRFEEIYTDQVFEKNGKINYYIYVLGENFQCNFKLLNLNRDYSDLVKTYDFGKNIIAIGEKDFTGTLTITSFNAKLKTISGNFSYTSTSEYKGYKSSPAKI
ncbi:MAG: hypothetical protein RLZZ175_3024, partial [Bacteroidota bacterium]